tara:strand:+ start:38164 stop:38487 length:324 start_codon:yes stop_codon:yes gene_type:complete
LPKANIVLLTVVLIAPNAWAAEDVYYDLIYDYEVASFCGLISKEVYDAFWQKRRVIEATNPRTDTHLTKTRIRAMAAADLEFQNRGLGGYKPWCRSDGVAGIQRILD